jgi:hypothetical protein
MSGFQPKEVLSKSSQNKMHMERNTRAIAALKTDIKRLSAEQKTLRPQRKSVHFTGIRTVPAWKATADHLYNRWELRYLYLAYGIMRGKHIEQMEPTAKTLANAERIAKVINKYEEVVCDNA